MDTFTSHETCPVCGETLRVIWRAKADWIPAPRTAHRWRCPNGCVVSPEAVARCYLQRIDHRVVLYECGSTLLQMLIPFVRAGLADGEDVIVVATGDHLSQVSAALTATEFAGRLVPISAEDIRDCIYGVGNGVSIPDPRQCGSPRPGPFEAVRQSVGAGRRVRVFAEVVALLWADQNVDMALEIEQHWNRLQAQLGFSLWCGYPADVANDSRFEQLCQVHTNAVVGPATERSGQVPLARLATTGGRIDWSDEAPSQLTQMVRPRRPVFEGFER